MNGILPEISGAVNDSNFFLFSLLISIYEFHRSDVSGEVFLRSITASTDYIRLRGTIILCLQHSLLLWFMASGSYLFLTCLLLPTCDMFIYFALFRHTATSIRLIPTAKRRVPSQVTSYQIRGGRSGIGVIFSLNLLVLCWSSFHHCSILVSPRPPRCETDPTRRHIITLSAFNLGLRPWCSTWREKLKKNN
jgi:hypothetical protein